MGGGQAGCTASRTKAALQAAALRRPQGGRAGPVKRMHARTQRSISCTHIYMSASPPEPYRRPHLIDLHGVVLEVKVQHVGPPVAVHALAVVPHAPGGAVGTVAAGAACTNVSLPRGERLPKHTPACVGKQAGPPACRDHCPPHQKRSTLPLLAMNWRSRSPSSRWLGLPRRASVNVARSLHLRAGAPVSPNLAR